MANGHIGFPFFPFSFSPLHTSSLPGGKSGFLEVNRRVYAPELGSTGCTAVPAGPTENRAVLHWSPLSMPAKVALSNLSLDLARKKGIRRTIQQFVRDFLAADIHLIN